MADSVIDVRDLASWFLTDAPCRLLTCTGRAQADLPLRLAVRCPYTGSTSRLAADVRRVEAVGGASTACRSGQVGQAHQQHHHRRDLTDISSTKPRGNASPYCGTAVLRRCTAVLRETHRRTAAPHRRAARTASPYCGDAPPCCEKRTAVLRRCTAVLRETEPGTFLAGVYSLSRIG
jgi:hypothetical protein